MYSSFAGRHPGATAWIFGSGPSFDAFLNQRPRPFIEHGDLIIGINESAIVLAAHDIACDYIFAADPMDHYAHALPPAAPIFVAQEAIDNARAPLPVNDLIVVPPGNARGTIILAGRVLRHMGITRLVCVGVDGTRTRGDQPWLSPPTLDANSYGIIKGIFLEWCHRENMPVTFWHPEIGGFFPPSDLPGLLPWLNRHIDGTAWLFGKGPSLAAFLAGEHPIQSLHRPDRGPDVVAFLSDTVSQQDEIIAAMARASGAYDERFDDPPVYCFANDAITRWHDLYHEWHTLFQPRRTVRDVSMSAPPPLCPRVVFEDLGGSPRRLDLPREHLAAGPIVAGHGTCDSAAQILHIMGCTRLIAIGCDGSPGRADMDWRTDIRADHAEDYAAIRRDFESILLRIGLETEFYGEPGILRRAPQHLQERAIRLTRSTVFRGAAHNAGAVFTECTAEEINRLIGCNKAERIYVPDTEPQPA